ncbi:MAG: hypothetical protein AAFN11_10075 [Chloroflexota bacterium]
MASENEAQTSVEETANETTLMLLSMLGGVGIFAMVIALGVGVVWADADSELIGLVVMIGAALLAVSVGGWVIVTRPYENFDDITVANYHGHHHDDDHHDIPEEVIDGPGETNVDHEIRT